jgi:hypothetical protein
MLLPPKRFEDDQDPKYDALRHLPWFGALRERRAKLPLLKQAYAALTCCAPEITQEQVASTWGVDPRELRDYVAFIQGDSKVREKYDQSHRRALQTIMDDAYANYCAMDGWRSFRWHLEQVARRWGFTPREVTELWEVDPIYFPTNYRR